jgi:hypothetical protein
MAGRFVSYFGRNKGPYEYHIFYIFNAVKAVNIQHMNSNERIYKMSVAGVYPHYVAKAEKKGRSKAEVDQIICWLTGYDEQQLQEHLARKTDFKTFFAQAPQFHPNAAKITGVICGYRVEEIDDALIQKVRYLDKLIDELAKGKSMDKILRQ